MEMLSDYEAPPVVPAPPTSGHEVLDCILSLHQDVAIPFAGLRQMVCDTHVSGTAGIEQDAARYIEALREKADELNAVDIPFFPTAVLREIGRNVRAPHQGYAFKGVSALARLPHCDELARSLHELGKLDPLAGWLLELWRRDHVLAIAAHAALYGRFDKHGNDLRHPEPAVSRDDVTAVASEVIASQGMALDVEHSEAVVRAAAYCLDSRARAGKSPTKGDTRRLIGKLLSAWPALEVEQSPEPEVEPNTDETASDGRKERKQKQ